METKVLFKGFQYRSSQDKVNKNSLYQDEVGGGCLQQDRWILWSSVCVCVFMCVGGCPFIYFSGGENSLAQLIFKLTLAYGETAGGGESGSRECILKIENRVNGNASKYKRIWEEVFLRIKITNGFEKVMLELKTRQSHTWRTTESVKRVETKSDQFRLRNTVPRKHHTRWTDYTPSLPSNTPFPNCCPSFSCVYCSMELL